MRNARKQIVLFPSSAASVPSLPYTVIYDDDFSDTDLSPIASPRTCVPGPGLLVPNSGSKLDIPGDDYIHYVNPNVGQARFQTGLARANGLALYIVDARRDVLSYPRFYCGWGPNNEVTTGHDSIRWTQKTFSFYEETVDTADGVPFLPSNEIANNQIDFLEILQAIGCIHMFRVRGVDTIPWSIGWVTRSNTTATVYPFFSLYYDGTQDAKIDNAQVIQLGGAFTTQGGIASFSSPTPSDGDTNNGTAELLQYFEWTPAAGETFEMSFRRTDDNNRFLLRCSQADSTIKAVKIEGGSETELQSTAKTWTAGTKYRIGMRLHTGVGPAQYLRAHATGGFASLIGVNIGTFNQSAVGCKVAGFSTGENWEAYPITAPATVTALLPS